MDRSRIHVQRRPVSDAELGDLQRRASEAEAADSAALRRYWTSIRIRAGLLAAIYIALWAYTLRMHLDLTKPLVATFVPLTVAIPLFVWEWRAGLGRVARTRETWAKAIEDVRAHPVVQVDIHPVQVWLCEEGWLFDLGSGQGLFTLWDLTREQVRATLSLRRAASGFSWIEASGGRIPVNDLFVDWNKFPNDHPLTVRWEPALFRLDTADPASAMLAFQEGSFISLQ